MNRFVISGTGMVGPLGNRNEAVWSAVKQGATGIRRLNKFTLPGDILCGEVKDFDFSEYVPDKRFRRAAPISQYALAAASMALAEVSDNENASLIIGITHGALGYTQAFHKELLKSGPESVSPIYFSDSVLNAPAGNISLCFGIKGPVHTILGGTESVIKAMITGCRLLDEGETQKAVVVSSEELNELSLFCYTRLGFNMISEGAGAIVIERDDASVNKNPYCFISAMVSECNPSDPGSALENAAMSCIEKAGMKIADIDILFADEDDSIPQGLREVPIASLASFSGNAFAASLLWEIVLSCMAVQKGTIPQSIIKNGKPRPNLNNVMICTADKNGNAAAVILSKYA